MTESGNYPGKGSRRAGEPAKAPEYNKMKQVKLPV